MRNYYREEEFADNFIINSDDDFERIVAKLKMYDVKLIVPGCESGVNLADKLSQYFDVPKNDYKKSLARRNKFTMIETIKNHGLLYANQIKTNNLQEILDWLDLNKYEKIVLKPLASSSSDGVFYCRDHREIKKAFDAIYQTKDMYNEINDEVLVQEFLDGDEYIVNTVSRDGIHCVSDIWKGVSMDKSLVSNDSYAEYISPVMSEHKILSEYAKKVLDALGISNGPAHSEIRLTSDGPCLIETGARLAGKVDFSAVENVCGTSQISLTAEAFLEPEIFKDRINSRMPKHINKYARYVYFSSNHNGIIKQDPYFEDILKIESLSTLCFVFEKGDRLLKTSKAFRNPRPGYAYLVAPNAEKLEADYQALRREESNLYSKMLSD